MIIDTSALLAILLREPDAVQFERLIATTPNCRMSVANALEASVVVEGRGSLEAGIEFDVFLEGVDIKLAPVTAEHLIAARRAWRHFGKGKHRAAFNFGDRFAYALAEATAEPLLYKADDFKRTDIPTAIPSEGDVSL